MLNNAVRILMVALLSICLIACSTKKQSPELIAAINRSDVAEVAKLLASGANPDSRGGDQNATALSHAVHRGSVDIINLLIKHGADVNKGEYGFTPLFWATNNGLREESGEMIKALVKGGAKIDAVDSQLNTALMNICRHKNGFGVASILLELGADKAKENKLGKNALTIAIENNADQNLINLLKGTSSAETSVTQPAQASAAQQTKTNADALSNFIEKRGGCDHFRGEYPYDEERQKFLEEKIKELCTGTDSQLSDLKKQNATDPIAMAKLNKYEAQIEPKQQAVTQPTTPAQASSASNNMGLDFLFKKGGYWVFGLKESGVKCRELLPQSDDIFAFQSFSTNNMTIKFGVGDKRLYKEYAKKTLPIINVPSEYTIIDSSPRILKVKVTSNASNGAIIEEYFEVSSAGNSIAIYAVGRCINCGESQQRSMDKFTKSKNENPNYKEPRYWCSGDIE